MLDLYRLEVGRFPADDEGLQALVERPGHAEIWNGPYLKNKDALIDPWGMRWSGGGDGKDVGVCELRALRKGGVWVVGNRQD